MISLTALRNFSTSAADTKYCSTLFSEIPICPNNFFRNCTCLYVTKFPFPNSHSCSFQPIIAIPSAPLTKDSNIKSKPTRPVHFTRSKYILVGYDFLLVPVKSATLYPHFSQANAIILGFGFRILFSIFSLPLLFDFYFILCLIFYQVVFSTNSVNLSY